MGNNPSPLRTFGLQQVLRPSATPLEAAGTQDARDDTPRLCGHPGRASTLAATNPASFPFPLKLDPCLSPQLRATRQPIRSTMPPPCLSPQLQATRQPA
ncbi:hypothetical protein BDN71DRAFT_1514744 [Pleurotus eryngii]|uniref:Uncharacterized protein n=1 Tax=Pleurotus eryngii TaxID=5323 RepID=A0A9P6D8C7_PLEER|nr:hypothetical protein BDN71DRAFT_1514752 [Pleurotus eryngii]KAF9486679.1 hypothetical protein BDN71DRAFT_1514744 [Pleurotus eryngii]